MLAYNLRRCRQDARPLWDPIADPEILLQTEPGVWKFELGTRPAGPWLIIGWTGNWCRLRPLLWVVDDDPALTQAASATSSEPITIADITRIADREGTADWLRQSLFQRLAEKSV